MDDTQKHFFGTDGIRGAVGTFPITPDFVLRFGAAVGRWLHEQGSHAPTVLIGKDTRISGYVFESALQSGLLSTGAHVQLLGPIATPAVAYLLRTFGADVGVMISASHNEFTDNGIKLFFNKGYKLSNKQERQIETHLRKQEIPIVPCQDFGKASRISDAVGRYVEYCKSSIDVRLQGLKIVLDCAHGANYNSAPKVFRELGADIVTIHAEPDGININHNCGSTCPTALQKAVVEHGADLGVAFDGDGDRVALVDHEGQLLDGDDVLYAIATHQAHTGVVGTIMSNQGLVQVLAKRGIDFLRTDVGDKHIIHAMLQHDWSLGGEPSGHIIFGTHCTSGDGIIAALQVIAAMLHSNNSLSALRQSWQRMYQYHTNITCTDFKPLDSEQMAQFETTLGEGGRIVVRQSGTEKNLVRIMTESIDKTLGASTAQCIKNTIMKQTAS